MGASLASLISSPRARGEPRHGLRFDVDAGIIAGSGGKLRSLGTETRHLAEGRVGTLLDGKWSLDALLGYGGSAAVYAATHRNGKRAAIKVLHPHYVGDENLRGRFTREGYVANKIEHPGAVSVLDDDVAADGTVYLVMELLEGTSLEKIGQKVGRGEAAPLTMAEVVRIVDDLLDVLSKAHAIGIVHRDIKPANLFVTTTGQVKVLDFGIAGLAEAKADGSSLTQTGFMMGTPAFMPPEQARGRWAEVDARSDVFAAGATMLALFTGRRPRRAETANEELLAAMTAPLAPAASLVPSLPPAIAFVIDRAVAWNRDERWPTAQAMQQALRAAARESEASLGAPATGDGAPIAPFMVTTTLVTPSAPPRGAHPAPAASVEPPPGLTTSRAVLHSAAPPATPKKSTASVAAVSVGLLVVVVGLAAGGGLYVRARGGTRAATPAPLAADPASGARPGTPALSEDLPRPTSGVPGAASAVPGVASAVPGPASSVPGAASAVPGVASVTGHAEATPAVGQSADSAASTSAPAKLDAKPGKTSSPFRPTPSASADPAKYFDSRF